MERKKCAISKKAMLKNLAYCLEREEKALELYQELMPLLKDRADIVKIQSIIKDEIRHIDMVKDLLQVFNVYFEDK